MNNKRLSLIEDLVLEVAALRKENAALKANVAELTAHNSAMPKSCCHVCGNVARLVVVAECETCHEDIDVTHEYIVSSKTSA